MLVSAQWIRICPCWQQALTEDYLSADAPLAWGSVRAIVEKELGRGKEPERGGEKGRESQRERERGWCGGSKEGANRVCIPYLMSPSQARLLAAIMGIWCPGNHARSQSLLTFHLRNYSKWVIGHLQPLLGVPFHLNRRTHWHVGLQN